MLDNDTIKRLVKRARFAVNTADFARECYEEGQRDAQQRIAELERDAARWRWLRGDSPQEYSDRWTQWEIRCWRAPFWTADLRHEHLDDAVDTAMRKEGGG